MAGALVLGALVSVAAGPVRAGAVATFSDVPAGHTFFDDVEWVAAEGIATGYVDGTFRPSSPVTRQAMVAFLHRFSGAPAGPFPDPGFPDVPASHRFATEIWWAADAGVTTGYLDGRFRPSSVVTRQSTAAFLHRIAGSPSAAPDAPSFWDVGVEHPFHPEIAWLAGAGITTGYSNGSFRPASVVTRQSMAAFLHRLDAYEPPAPPVLGNPTKLLGSDPVVGNGQPNVWLTLGAPEATKVSGDRYQNGICGEGAGGTVTGCTSSSGPSNEEHDPDGHRFVVHVDEIAPGQPLRIQVYDPAYTYQNDFCSTNNVADSGSRLLSTLAGLPETTMDDAVSRFASGNTTYCVGDQRIIDHQVATTYVVRTPDDTPDDDLDNPIIGGCTRTFTGRNIAGSQIWDRLRETSSYDQPSEWGLEGVPFRQHFRQWFTLCSIPSPIVGDYVVQVVSDSANSLMPPAVDDDAPSGGHNRFALRAGFGGAAVPGPDPGQAPDGAGVQVAPLDHHVVSLNGGAGDEVVQHLTRVLPNQAGQVLSFELFDVGDVGGSVSLQIQPPVDAGLPTFPDCVAERDGPAFTVPIANCAITGMTQAGYNGRTVTVSVPIPEDYTCIDGDPAGCWVRLHLTFSGGATPSDTFTITPVLPPG